MEDDGENEQGVDIHDYQLARVGRDRLSASCATSTRRALGGRPQAVT